MGYWKTPEEMGLTTEQINDICEKLWIGSTLRNCNDCGAEPGERHMRDCDVARCTECEGQRLSCGCKKGNEDVWTGVWPGYKECYEQKLITTCDTLKGEWMFDLNTLYSKK